ncbi:MAG: serine hydrolase [Gammaproteobacteria bacterium]|nr:serine hydrolase [Gammaproteobacteria bacterium]
MKQNSQLSPHVNESTPAFATLIIKNNQTVFKGVQGCAVLGKNQCIAKATLETPFSICSTTKLFTAVLILMLEEEGRLSIADRISMHIPKLPLKFKGITIQHLLFHISGIPEYLPDPSIVDFDQMIKERKQLTQSAIFESILKSKPQPHSKAYAYSNSGYALLSKIIENITGESYAKVIQKRIFDPLDMNTAFVMTEIDQHSHYTEAYNQWPLYTPTNWMKAATPTGEGGIFMSINDMEKWIHAFNQAQIFSKKKTMKRLLSTGKYDDGKDVMMAPHLKYGFGLMHGQAHKNGKRYKVTGHNGGMPGSTSVFANLHHKNDNIWIIYFSNTSSYPDIFSVLDQANIEY